MNEASEHNYDLCGNISMIEKKHYSSGRALIFEFHTDDMQQNNIGFRGRYKFLNKSECINELYMFGEQLMQFRTTHKLDKVKLNFYFIS